VNSTLIKVVDSIKQIKIEQVKNKSFDNVRENFKSIFYLYCIPWIQLQLGPGDLTSYVNFRMSPLIFFQKILITFIK